MLEYRKKIHYTLTTNLSHLQKNLIATLFL